MNAEHNGSDAQRRALSTAGSGDDTGARLAHLQDLIAAHAGERRAGLLTDYHEAQGAGAMHAPDEPGIVLVTLISREGSSHVYALTRDVASHLREQLHELRRVSHVVPKDSTRSPMVKPSGRIL